jgi:hypothetical protein
MKPLFQTVAFFDLGVGEARFACVAYASFGQIEIIVQVLQFLAQRGLMAFSFHNFDFAPGKIFVQKKSHRRRREVCSEPANQNPNGKEIGLNVRPHPGPLLQERENHPLFF